MANHVAQQVLEFCQKNGLLLAGDKVVVGVSGGVDSLALLHLLKSFSADLDLSLIVAHLDHQLRGPAGRADADFVRDIAYRWQLPVVVESRPVAALARQRKQSLEEAARQIRYAFLWQAASEAGANKIAVAHHADDQVETTLMHFLRGTGLAGLRGMLPIMDIAELHLPDELSPPPSPLRRPSPQLIRPFLETSRAQLEAYVQAQGLSPRQDQSNEDITFFRNRLRHELIPYLETYNPNIREVLQRTAKIAAADAEILREQLDKAWRLVVKYESSEQVAFDLHDWRSLPLALKRSTLRRAIESLRRGLRNINFEHIEDAIEIAEKGRTGARATLPQGLWLAISYDTLLITAEEATPGPEFDQPHLAGDEVVAVNLPGLTQLPGTPWQLRASLLAPETLTGRQISQVGRWEAYLDADAVGPAPILRSRRPGDRFFPLGLDGHSQKVNDFMINQKIPAAWRGRIPLLVADDRVLWLCGYRLDERARLQPTTRRVLYLRLERR